MVFPRRTLGITRITGTKLEYWSFPAYTGRPTPPHVQSLGAKFLVAVPVKLMPRTKAIKRNPRNTSLGSHHPFVKLVLEVIVQLRSRFHH